MKKKIALGFLALAVLLSMASCNGMKPEQGGTDAVTKEADTTVEAEETEKTEESEETQEMRNSTASIRVISLKGPTSIGLVHLMEKTEKEGLG